MSVSSMAPSGTSAAGGRSRTSFKRWSEQFSLRSRNGWPAMLQPPSGTVGSTRSVTGVGGGVRGRSPPELPRMSSPNVWMVYSPSPIVSRTNAPRTASVNARRSRPTFTAGGSEVIGERVREHIDQALQQRLVLRPELGDLPEGTDGLADRARVFQELECQFQRIERLPRVVGDLGLILDNVGHQL